MFGGVPIASQGQLMMVPGFPSGGYASGGYASGGYASGGYAGGGYPAAPTFQGNPAMGRPMMIPGQAPGFAQGSFQGNPGMPPAPTFAPVNGQQPGRPLLAQGPSVDPTPQPKFRAQAPDEPPPPSRLSLPAPEALGVRPAAAVSLPATVDWNAVRERLSRLGAQSFRVDRIDGGGFRMIVLLPTQDPQRTRHVEASAATERAAVDAALEQAEATSQVRRG